MAESESILKIFNKAGAVLGVVGSDELPEIQSLTEDTKIRRLCSMFYDAVRREVLRGYPWNCATILVDLGAPIATAPLFGFDHAYTLPANPKSLRVLCMEGWDDEDPPRWVVRGNNLLYTDEDEAHIAYIWDLEDVTKMDPLLIEAIYTKLAWKIGPGLGVKFELIDKIWKMYEGIIEPNGRSINSQESSGDQFVSYSWLNARR